MGVILLLRRPRTKGLGTFTGPEGCICVCVGVFLGAGEKGRLGVEKYWVLIQSGEKYL